jgi:hypothetical protein
VTGAPADREAKFDVPALMAALATSRPIFHSEADFQHALAWQIQLGHPQAQLRLETRPRRQVHLDLLVRLPDRRVAIELKYLVARFEGTVDGESFDLPGGGAQDTSRHDVVKDIVRVETVLADSYADEGWVIVLSNDSSYSRPGLRPTAIDGEFRLHEGQVLAGPRKWAINAGQGTTKGRDQPLNLAGSYVCAWRDYSTVRSAAGRQTTLRYLALSVRTPGTASPIVSTVRPPGAPAPVAAGANAGTPPADSSSIDFSALPVRDQILFTARRLAALRSDQTFTLGEVLTECRRLGSRYQDSTIRTQVSSVMCANSPDNHAITYRDLLRVDHGRYRLLDPVKDHQQ